MTGAVSMACNGVRDAALCSAFSSGGFHGGFAGESPVNAGESPSLPVAGHTEVGIPN